MKNQKFEEKVRSMSGKEIVLAMIHGLEHEWVKVNMCSYADIRKTPEGEVCFGCAATNTVCEIASIKFTTKNIGGDLAKYGRGDAVNSDYDFLDNFEMAIDKLRRGLVLSYNRIAEHLQIAVLPKPEYNLPRLENDNYKEDLDAYRKYAESLP